jgi:uncharacterized RDD family membrane protein YckC
MVLKRIFAYGIDYVIIMIYAGILFLISYGIHSINNLPIEVQEPITGNIISFLSLTLPVFMYFFLSESSKKQGTLGKQILKIKVQNNTTKNIFIRVFLKILPWEVAHFGVHFMMYYDSLNIEIPLWNWIIIIAPQVLVLIYFISVLKTKGKSSLHDRVANTSITSY